MKNIIFILVGLIISCGSGASQGLSDGGMENIHFQISTKKGSDYTPDSVPVVLEFVNAGNTNVKLLDVFKPLPVFLSIEINKADGTGIDLPGGGKVSFSSGKLAYVEIPKKSSYYKEINLGEAVKKYGHQFSKGTYTIRMIYHNQYGENCIKGWFESKPIEIKIE